MTATSGGALLPALLLLVLALAIVCAALLARQLRQRRELRTWLEAPAEHPLPDGVGAWRGIFSSLQRLQKEEQRRRTALAATLERFRLAAEAMPDGIILLDGQLYIEWLNAAACRHFTLDPDRDVGTLAEQLIRLTEFHVFLAAYRQGIAPESILLRVGANGAERTLSVMLIAFADTGTLLLSRDITELARAETVHRDFIANVSHELRTPLTVITGFLEQFTAEQAPTEATARTFHKLMAEQADRMNRLVADLLALSRLENDSQPPRDEIIDVPALVETLRTEAEALSGGRHEIVTGAIAADRLRGSPDELRSAFGNLVFNAVRYTPAGGTITLGWRIEDGSPVFSVSDTGIGIPAEHLPRLTERFYRVDKGRSTAAGGTGLGLAIVKHVLARHGGTLQIHSTLGQGSTFTLRLPADRRVQAVAG